MKILKILTVLFLMVSMCASIESSEFNNAIDCRHQGKLCIRYKGFACRTFDAYCKKMHNVLKPMRKGK